MNIVGEAELTFVVGSTTALQTFKVFPNCEHDGIIGIDLIELIGPATIDTKNRRLKLDGTWVPFKGTNRAVKPKVAALETVKAPPRAMVVLQGKSAIPAEFGGELIFEQDNDKVLDYFCPRILVTASDSVPIRVLNPSETSITIYQGTTLGHCEVATGVHMPTESVCVVEDNIERNEALRGHSFDMSTLDWEEQEELKALLVKYEHLFAKSDHEISGKPAMSHKIELSDNTLFRHRAYRVPQAQRGHLTSNSMKC